MYVRWKTKRLTGKNREAGERSLYAVLVASERRDGKPRQQVIKHLAHIRERDLESAEHHREFWLHVSQSLASLHLSPLVLQTVESRLAERVPGLLSAPRDGEQSTSITVPALPRQNFDSLINWASEIRQLPGSCISFEGLDNVRYVIGPELFALLNPMLRARIRSRITLEHVMSSLVHIHRFGDNVRARGAHRLRAVMRVAG